MRPETRQLVQFLRDCHLAGKMATYKEMSELIHADVQTKERPCLQSALSIAEREHDIAFENVPRQGYRPLTPEEVVTVRCSDRKRKIKSTARRWRNDLESVDVTKLSNDAVMQYSVKGLELAAIEAATSDETEKQIQAKVQKSYVPMSEYSGMSMDDLLKLLGAVS